MPGSDSNSPLRWYETNARLVADRHESLEPATVHSWWLDQLPSGPANLRRDPILRRMLRNEIVDRAVLHHVSQAFLGFRPFYVRPFLTWGDPPSTCTSSHCMRLFLQKAAQDRSTDSDLVALSGVLSCTLNGLCLSLHSNAGRPNPGRDRGPAIRDRSNLPPTFDMREEPFAWARSSRGTQSLPGKARFSHGFSSLDMLELGS